MYQKMIFHYDCMYVILKNHRIKESICHSIPRALKAKFYNCISPSGRIGGGAGGGRRIGGVFLEELPNF